MAEKQQMSKGNGADKAKDLAPFGMNSLQPVDQTNVRHRLNVPLLGVEPEDLELGIRWSVVAQKLRPFDIVEVVGYGGAWFAEVLVVDAQRGNAIRVKVLRSLKIEAPVAKQEADLPAGHDIKFDPQAMTYTGIRIEGNVPLTPPQRRWSDAYSLLVNHASLRGS